jgi:hypothetical protein
VKKCCAEETNARNDQASRNKVSRFAKRCEELARRTRAKESLEVKLAKLDDLRGKRWDALMNRVESGLGTCLWFERAGHDRGHIDRFNGNLQFN